MTVPSRHGPANRRLRIANRAVYSLVMRILASESAPARRGGRGHDSLACDRGGHDPLAATGAAMTRWLAAGVATTRRRTAGAATTRWLAAGATLLAAAAGFMSLSAVPQPGSGDRAATLRQDTVSFADDVAPIFRQRCAQCHGAEDEDGVRAEAGLMLLTYEQVMAGSEFGTVVEAGDPAKSYLLEMIVEGDMPEEGDPVPAEEIEIIRAWIEAGAPNN